MDLESLPSQLETDRVFAFLYPICQLADIDTEKTTALVHELAATLKVEPMQLATDIRKHIALKSQQQ